MTYWENSRNSQLTHTCWFSVLIEKAEMSKSVLSNNPNEIRIHIICKSEQNEINFCGELQMEMKLFQLCPKEKGIIQKFTFTLFTTCQHSSQFRRNSQYLVRAEWSREQVYILGKIFIFPFMYRGIPQIPFHKWFLLIELCTHRCRKKF
jgi:hypothetical protein